MALFDTYAAESITIKGKGSLGGDGVYDYSGSTTNTTGRVSENTKIMRDNRGTEVVYPFVVYLKASVTVVVGDRVTFGGKNHEARHVEKVKNLDGVVDHQRVYLERRSPGEA